MSERPKQQTPFVSPDSFRQFLTMLKHFYQLHTSTNNGCEDENGVHYASTVENFGSEILVEANKLRSKKPPIGLLSINDALKSYFEIQHSGFISTFEQQNMLCCLLKSNTLLNGYQYDIQFNDVVEFYTLRSESTSDPIVRRDLFFATTTPPTLTITSPNGDVITTDLIVQCDPNDPVWYFYPVNDTTNDLAGINGYSDITRIINEKTFTIHITTASLTNIPYIWFCSPDFKTFPDVTLTNNLDGLNRPLLTFGTDGHDRFNLFPQVERNNIPLDFFQYWSDPEYTFFIKVRGDFVIPSTNEYNYTSKITSIEYIVARSILTEPVATHIITCDDSFVKMHLSKDVAWSFRTPQPGEYDYNPDTSQNKRYAYIDFSAFKDNHSQYLYQRDELKAAFVVDIDERHYIHTIEQFMNHCVSGIHIDDSAEQSDHGISKIHGVIRDLGEFDGLPRYFASWLEYETNRAHVEVYAIRDNLVTNSPMNRQTAALIIDSAVPQSDVDMMIDDLEITIEYSGDGVFNTTGQSESATNYLSDLIYVNDYTFAQKDVAGVYMTNPKFIYHGNGMFSLGKQGFDPELEVARVYAITNDPATYENNEIAVYQKSARCVCRICDIPTSYVQLIHITGVAPTFALDPSYVRQEAQFTESDANLIWNELGEYFLSTIDNGYCKMIFNTSDDLDVIFPTDYLETYYSTMTNLNASLDMSDPDTSSDYEFTINQGGSDYTTDSTFTILIGGSVIDGTITSVEDGVVTSISITPVANRFINAGNILSQNMVCKTTTTHGTGSGLMLTLSLQTTAWNSLQMQIDGIRNDLHALKFDEFGNVWIWSFNGTTWVRDTQVTGQRDINNRYDKQPTDHTEAWNESYIQSFPWQKRDLVDVYLYDKFYQHQRPFYPFEQNVTKSYENVITQPFDPYHETTDRSGDIIGWNYPETLYTITQNANQNNVLNILPLTDTTKWMLFPYNHDIQLYNIDQSPCRISYTQTTSQPSLSIYDPMLDHVDVLTHYTPGIDIFVSSTPITFNTRFNEDVVANGVLKTNVYDCSYRNCMNDFHAIYQNTLSRDRSDIISELQSIAPDCDPCIAESTDYRYSITALANYVIQNLTDRMTIGTPDEIKLFRTRNEQVVDTNGLPIGDQPIGGEICITDDVYHCNVTVNDGTMTTVPTYVFRIDDASITSLDGFKMYDENGVDISANVLLIVNNIPYTYNNGWVRINTQNRR